MSDTNTPATEKKKSVAKLPENLYYKDSKTKEIMSKPAETIIAAFVKQFGVKAIGKILAEDVVKTILLASIKALPEQPELAEGFEDAESFTKDGTSLPDFLHKFALTHAASKREIEEQKQTQKQAAKEEKEAAAKAKKDEDKKYQQEADEFGEMLVASVEKSAKTIKKLSEGILGSLKLPSNITISQNSMGILVAEGTSKADIAVAASSVLATYEGVKNAEGVMQFLMGDLVNASVKAKTFRTQNDAASGLKFIIQEKCGKTYEIGTIQQYAMMADRIPAAKRVMGVKPSLYLAAAKVTPPRLKAARPEDEKEAAESVASFRDDLISDINSGKVNTSTIKQKVDAFKTERGWIKPVENDKAAELAALKTLFLVDFLTAKLSNRDKVVVGRGKESHSYSTAELAEKRDEAFEYLANAFIESEGLDIEALQLGTKIVEKNGKSKEVPYRLPDPFFVKAKESKQEEPEQALVEEVVEETETEEEEEEDTNEVEF